MKCRKEDSSGQLTGLAALLLGVCLVTEEVSPSPVAAALP